ncbi:mechanosensitive ion channel [Colwellia sp. BRX10-3]|uniref:mechanosensitive ion channel domain-containing protein n=1 Tax=Colwellia sp. BRX10-3 TaxID=2759844 RepID=UPI0015F6EC16|nr:mechanosensitive ion channel domain-containing protein [Colwellia sp. BRX10-3]MBA6391528.1 mechanosensitive ion channel [Colwellia sp. BRX10-3]
MLKQSVCAFLSLVFILLIGITQGGLIPKVAAQESNLANDIETTIERVQQTTDLDEKQRKDTLIKLEDAQDMLATAKEQQRLTIDYEDRAASASQNVIAIRQSNQALREQVVQIDKSQSADKLKNQLLLQRAEQKNRLSVLSEKQSEQTVLSLRANKIAEQLSATRADETAINQAIAKQNPDNINLEARADHLEKLANAHKLAATIEALESEIATIPARKSLVEAELSQLRTQSSFYEKQIALLQSYLADNRKSEVKKTVERSSAVLAKLKQQPALEAMASENLLLANQLQDLQTLAPESETNVATLQKQLVEVQQSSETVDRVLATGRVTDELGELLRRLRASLPVESVLEQRNEKLEESTIRQQLDVILWQDRLRSLAHIPDAAERLLIENSPALSKKTKQSKSPELSENAKTNLFTALELKKAEELTRSRRDLIRNLIDASNMQADRTTDEKLALSELLMASSALSALLERRLIWLPSSSSGIAGNFGLNLLISVEWFFSPTAWWSLVNDLYNGAISSPFLLLLFITIPLLILASRRAIKRTLWTLFEKVGDVEHDTYFSTPLALLLTFALALPLPVCLFAVAGMISEGAQPMSFSIAIATGLAAVSSLSLILLFFRSMCRENGMFEKHFGWSANARLKLRAMLSWFVWLESVTGFVFATAIASGETELRYGIAILAFIISSVGIAVFSYQFFQPKSGVATSIAGDTPANILTIIAFPIAVLAPFAIGLMPLIGYFDTAVELQSKVFMSGTLLVMSAVIYGIMLRVFLVTFRRYMVRKEQKEAEDLAIKNAEPKVESSGDAIATPEESKSIDEEEVKRQSQSIMRWFTGLLLLAGLWFIWMPLLPALGIVDDIIVWQQVKIVDGVELSSGVTLWNIILSLAFVVGGILAAKNIRGVMEIGFFERFEMDDGARYAIMSILGYVIVGSGIVIGFSQLGIDWSKLQWIIAALGVGLGFGLQEIVANFVSGLIILFERPIRVGDFVTIGNLSGTVSNIKIRATTVTDFDNREVLLPNKSIITENVINWTLKDAVTRIVVKVGVAYGSDIEKVTDILMQAVKAEKDVLELPSPQVFFLEHGDSSLDFEIRAFVSQPTNRLPLTHLINIAINKALAENEIAIPFPQRDLHLVSGKLIEKTETD